MKKSHVVILFIGFAAIIGLGVVLLIFMKATDRISILLLSAVFALVLAAVVISRGSRK